LFQRQRVGNAFHAKRFKPTLRELAAISAKNISPASSFDARDARDYAID